jgi:hypothetical protein
MAERAGREKDPTLRRDYDQLMLFYVRLASQAEQNATTDIVYEAVPLSSRPQQQQQQQQQQQPQPTPKRDHE